jgi:hypothetical protein
MMASQGQTAQPEPGGPSAYRNRREPGRPPRASMGPWAGGLRCGRGRPVGAWPQRRGQWHNKSGNTRPQLTCCDGHGPDLMAASGPDSSGRPYLGIIVWPGLDLAGQPRRRRIRDLATSRRTTSPASQPVMTLTWILLPEPFGPIRLVGLARPEPSAFDTRPARSRKLSPAFLPSCGAALRRRPDRGGRDTCGRVSC